MLPCCVHLQQPFATEAHSNAKHLLDAWHTGSCMMVLRAYSVMRVVWLLVGINEQLLYHGTSSTVADIIIREGFDIRMANAGSYGRGTYFSNNSSTAVGYCQSKDRYSLHRRAADSSTAVYKLLVARVALGRQCQGSSGCTKPGAGFDSMNGHNATSHVVFDNHQAYPEYVITLKQFICRQ